jgi:hypothetical protein
MSLSDLAAIGSFVSGIAVVISFIFLALQVRQANRNQRSLIQQARSSRNVESLHRMADQPISELLARAETEPESLCRAEIWSLYGFGAAVFWSYEDTYMQFKAGTLHAGSWQSDLATLQRILAFPWLRVIWRMARDGMDRDYRNYVDSLMREVAADRSARFSDFYGVYLAEELSGVSGPVTSEC